MDSVPLWPALFMLPHMFLTPSIGAQGKRDERLQRRAAGALAGASRWACLDCVSGKRSGKEAIGRWCLPSQSRGGLKSSPMGFP